MVLLIVEHVRNRRFNFTTGAGMQRRLQRVKNGIPHGTALAPFLFNIYIYYVPVTVAKNLLMLMA